MAGQDYGFTLRLCWLGREEIHLVARSGLGNQVSSERRYFPRSVKKHTRPIKFEITRQELYLPTLQVVNNNNTPKMALRELESSASMNG